ncbi:MAG: hypothetical protein KL840_21895 [Aquamicrobium sp.]|nr:hypothetical protein [Aquamicrobium sp.]
MHGMIGRESSPPRPIVRRHSDWTLKEHEVVVSFWPDIEEIEKRLPHRTKAAIRGFAGKCNLRKQIHSWTDEQHSILRQRVRHGVPTAEIAKELGLTRLQVVNRMQYSRLTYPRRPPNPTGNELIDSIRKRAFECNVSMKELDEACKSGAQFRRYSASRRIHIKHVVQATKVLDGDLVIRWSDQ